MSARNDVGTCVWTTAKGTRCRNQRQATGLSPSSICGFHKAMTVRWSMMSRSQLARMLDRVMRFGEVAER